MNTPICSIERETLAVTDEMRSMILTAFISARTHPEACLSCPDDAVDACAQIVGQRFAEELCAWWHGELGCHAFADPAYERDVVRRYTAKIVNLETLTIESVM